MKVRPYKDRILVLQQTLPSESSGGIILPYDNQTINEGVVVGVGWEVTDNIQEGDYIVFGEYDGHPLTAGKKQYHLILEEDIRAILEKEDEDA